MLINLAYLLNRPTGTTNYALNLLPYLAPLDPQYLATPASGLPQGPNYLPVPSNLTAAQGIKGHLRRLWWTQFQLPRLCHQASGQGRSPFLFSPIPEAPVSLLGARRLGLGSSGPHRGRFAVTFHDLIPLRFPQFFGAIKLFYRHYVPRVLAQAETVICNSEASARDIVDFYGISARKLVPIPLAYDRAHFRPTPQPPAIPGHTLPQQPYFLMLGRQAPYKNLGRVIAAMAEVPAGCHLLIAGPTDPRYTPQLIDQAEALGVRSRIRFLSYVPFDQLPALLSGALALVFPSLWEGFGLPVLEAMACGTPVVCTCVASLPEVAGDAALLIDPTDTRAIAASMSRIATEQSLRSQLSEAGLKRAQQFSWEKTGRATVEVLQGLV